MGKHRYDSTMILSTSYNSQTESLTVRYADKKAFVYFNVPASLVRALERAKSPGHFWGSRRGQFGYIQVG
jgi:hypothetical protein